MTDKIFFDITALQYQLKNMTQKVKEFESGKKYLKMRQEFESVFDRQNMTIKKLEKELAAAHAETVTVRKIWSEAMDDMEAECKKEIHSLQREYLSVIRHFIWRYFRQIIFWYFILPGTYSSDYFQGFRQIK